MDNHAEIMQRIRAVTRTRTQNGLAALLGISQSSVSDAKKRHVVPAEWYLKLFDVLGVNPDWLKQGVGPVFLRTGAGYGPADADDAGDSEIDPALSVAPAARPAVVTVYAAPGAVMPSPVLSPSSVSSSVAPSRPGERDKAAAANMLARMRADLAPVGRIALPQSHSGPNILVLAVHTDAAAPLAGPGAYAGVDAAADSPTNGRVHALILPGEGPGLRRLFWDEQAGTYSARAENAAYPELRLTAASCRERLLGRLVWVLQEAR